MSLRVTIRVDDAYDNAATTIAPILAARGMRPSLFVPTDRIGLPGFLSASQIVALEAAGWEIGSHGRTFTAMLKDLPPEQQHTELAGSKSDLEALGVTVRSFAPGSNSWDASLAVMCEAVGYESASVGWAGTPYHLTYPITDRYNLSRSPSINSQGYSFADVKGWLDAANDDPNDTWLILLVHHVRDTPDSLSTTVLMFSQIVDYLDAIGATVVTQHDALTPPAPPAPSPPHDTISYDFSRVLDYERLPIDSQDVVTQARIVIAGNLSDPTVGMHSIVTPPFPDSRASPELAYFPAPIARAFTAPEHVTLQAQRSFALPAGVNPFLPRGEFIGESVTSVEFTGPVGALTDGSSSTHMSANTAIVSPPEIAWSFGNNREIVGFRLIYSMTLDSESGRLPFRVLVWVGSSFVMFGAPPTTYSINQYAEVVLEPSPEPREVIFVAPKNRHPGHPGGPGKALILTSLGYGGYESFRVFEFYPLVIDEPLVADIAAAQNRLPASHPRRVTVKGLLPPHARAHTVVGWPGGDFTGRVARQTYRDGATIVDFEQAGAPLGVPQEAVEVERIRANRTRELVRSASYPTLVGRRT